MAVVIIAAAAVIAAAAAFPLPGQGMRRIAKAVDPVRNLRKAGETSEIVAGLEEV